MKQSRPFYALQVFLARQQTSLIYFVELIKFMLTFSEIDECISNPCDTNAECKDAINSYTCKCKEGFTGDGISCIGNLHEQN